MIFCGGAVRNNPMIRSALEHTVGLPSMLSVSADEVHEGMMQLARKIDVQNECIRRKSE